MQIKRVLACFAAALMLASMTACSGDDTSKADSTSSAWSSTLPSDYKFTRGETYFGINKTDRKTLAVDENGLCAYKADGEDMLALWFNDENGNKLLAMYDGDGYAADEPLADYRIVEGKVELTIDGSTVTFDKVSQDEYTAYVQLLAGAENETTYAPPSGEDGDGNYHEHEGDSPAVTTDTSEEQTEPVTEEPVDQLSEGYIDDVAGQSYVMEDDDVKLTVYANEGKTMVSIEINADGFEWFYFKDFSRLDRAVDDGYMFKATLPSNDGTSTIGVYWSVPTGANGKIKVVNGETTLERDDLKLTE